MYDIERLAMEFLLAGDDPELGMLRDQFAMATVAERENTGVGFFTKFQIPNDLPRLGRKERIVIGDLYAEVEGNVRCWIASFRRGRDYRYLGMFL